MQISTLAKKMGITISAATLLGLSGCATISNGSNQTVTFHSEPSGAEVIVNGMSIGTTPLSHSLQRGAGTNVIIRKEGYQDSNTVLQTSTSGMFWGNIIIGGLPGSTTDGATGAMYEYTPGEIMVTLVAN